MKPCDVCRPVIREVDPDAIGVPLEAMPGGTVHRSDCPLVDMPRETKERLQAQFREFDRVRNRAAVEAQFYVVGGGR